MEVRRVTVRVEDERALALAAGLEDLIEPRRVLADLERVRLEQALHNGESPPTPQGK